MPFVTGLGPRRGRPVFAFYWCAISLIVLALDYLMGPVIQFPAVFVLPVSLAAWYSGWPWAMMLAAALPLVRLYFTTLLDAPWSFTEGAINAGIRIAVLASFALLVDRVAIQSAALGTRVQLLEGMLPICGVCKRIRDEGEAWRPLEQYVLAQSKDRVTHELCPECSVRVGALLDRR